MQKGKTETERGRRGRRGEEMREEREGGRRGRRERERERIDLSASFLLSPT
jgi:hypothetical protein